MTSSPLSEFLPVVEDTLDTALLTMAWERGEPLRAVEPLRPWQDFKDRSIEEIEQDFSRDRFMTPQQAKEYGFIDEILDHSATTAT